MMPNMPETVAAMLAAASLGAVWSSCSPDFGEQGVLDRFGQIEPVRLHRARRLLVQRQAERRDRQGAGGAGEAAERPPGDHRRLSRHGQAGGDRHAAAPSTLDDALAPFEAKDVTFERLPFSPPALHPVFVGHDRHPEMHRPLGRRHAAPAPQGAAAPWRPRGRRPPLLFHHLRLDDVELAGFRPRLRRHAAALRRLALPSRRQRPVRLRRRREDDLLRHLGEIHRLAAQVRAEADRHPRSLHRAHHLLHRLAAVAGRFCLRL